MATDLFYSPEALTSNDHNVLSNESNHQLYGFWIERARNGQDILIRKREPWDDNNINPLFLTTCADGDKILALRAVDASINVQVEASNLLSLKTIQQFCQQHKIIDATTEPYNRPIQEMYFINSESVNSAKLKYAFWIELV
jgi:hypothetical protein